MIIELILGLGIPALFWFFFNKKINNEIDSVACSCNHQCNCNKKQTTNPPTYTYTIHPNNKTTTSTNR